MIDVNAIGETAGLVYGYLKEHGQTTLTTLNRAIVVTGDLVPMAVGWLAREGKVEIVQEKRTLTIRLIEK